MMVNDRRVGAYRKAAQGPTDAAPEGGGLLKVPGEAPGAGKEKTGKESESPFRKVAKFLVLIGKEEAARILSRLSEEQAERIAAEIASIRHVDRDEASVVFAEFESLFRKARTPTGGVDTARAILAQAFGEERAEEMLRKSVPDIDGKPFDYFAGMSAERVDRLIAGELPAVKALVLSQLEPAQAAGVIKLMAPEEKKEIVLRLAKLTSIRPELIRRVDETMREKVLSVAAPDESAIDGRAALAEILKNMDSRSGTAILDGLGTNDPELGRDLRDRLFTERDAELADDRFVQEKLRATEDRDIALMIAGRSEGFRSKIFANVSKARGALILEEERLAAPVSRKDADRAYGAFFSALRAAWERGELRIADEKEEWVE